MNVNYDARRDGDFFKKERKKQDQIHEEGISPECPCEFNSSPVQLVKPDVPNHRIQQGCTTTRDKDTRSHGKQQTNCAVVFRKSCSQAALRAFDLIALTASQPLNYNHIALAQRKHGNESFPIRDRTFKKKKKRLETFNET